jgi:hypothetical protein
MGGTGTWVDRNSSAQTAMEIGATHCTSEMACDHGCAGVYVTTAMRMLNDWRRIIHLAC